MSEAVSALEGFAALMRQRVSALAVVSERPDGSHALVSALSAADLRFAATAGDLEALVRVRPSARRSSAPTPLGKCLQILGGG